MKDDLISRQAAIEAICEDGTQLERQGQYSMTMAERKQRDVDILEALPPAQPERIRGRWGTTVASPILIVCNRCGRTVLKNGSVHWNFCPNCGAKMEVSE